MECCPPVVDYLTYISLLAFIGGFQLEFISISRVINHMTCYNSSVLIGGKFVKKENPLQNLTPVWML